MMGIVLPLTDPVLKFLLILSIILIAPLLLNKLKIPHLLGLILAGALVGPKGFNLIERDSGIILSGTAGLLYIMFLAGLEIDLADFKKNSRKSLVFGLYTFLVPMTMGILGGLYILNFSMSTSVLLASMFASHTLIAYPLISKMGVSKNLAVNITVGGTIITDTLALLVLAVIVGMNSGEVNTEFWIRLSASILLFGLIVLLLFPILGSWFFKRFDDHISHYIFVLFMLFLGAAIAQLAGIEPIIGAFLSGLAMNRLIPPTSPLMNRVEFVGNAIFIPFFLISVGMLIDFRAFFKDWETFKVGTLMIIIATSAKFIAAWLAQKTYGLSIDQRRLIFGLSNAQAAATLAAVLVGYAIIIGEAPTGEPIRLLNENVLNGTILMILFTCTLATFVAQKGAKNIALQNNADVGEEPSYQEKILIPVSNLKTIDELIALGVAIKSKKNYLGLYALNVIDNTSIDGSEEAKARKILTKAAVTAAATDNILQELLRYDINLLNGITSVVKERNITDLILGLHVNQGTSDSFLGNLTENILLKCNATILIYKPVKQLASIKRYNIIVPDKAELEIGFPLWLKKVLNLSTNTGAKLIFYVSQETERVLKAKVQLNTLDVVYKKLANLLDLRNMVDDFDKYDNFIFVLSRKNEPSYHKSMETVPSFLDTFFKDNGFILIYPIQEGIWGTPKIDFREATFFDLSHKLDKIESSLTKRLKLR
ncbi:cation:proton antiporter [uncultured Maribacter sp.]|uniref:cation:proton antiporter n=1 Tax=uncultured Maribacter sp. TaxID=431308 RepID=UPI0030D84D0D